MLNFVLMLGIAMAIVHYFPSKSEMAKNVADKFPVQALAYMREHPAPGPIFNRLRFRRLHDFLGL